VGLVLAVALAVKLVLLSVEAHRPAVEARRGVGAESPERPATRRDKPSPS